MTDGGLEDRLLIRELVEKWVLYRDAGDWERFRSVWLAGARMMATWCQADAEGFIEASRRGWAKGVNILHFLGGSAIDLNADRAIAQTKMTISQRAEVDGVLVDVVCTGRFYDFIERREGSGACCCDSRSTKRTAWIRWTRPHDSTSTGRCSIGFHKAIGTSPICRRASAMR